MLTELLTIHGYSSEELSTFILCVGIYSKFFSTVLKSSEYWLVYYMIGSLISCTDSIKNIFHFSDFQESVNASGQNTVNSEIFVISPFREACIFTNFADICKGSQKNLRIILNLLSCEQGRSVNFELKL